MTENTTVVILAAGLGTRMKSRKAKVLHQAGGDTLLNQVIRAVIQVAPAEQIVAVIGHQAEQVQRSVHQHGVRFAIQAEQKGTGHAVLCAREAIRSAGGQLLILNGDGPLLQSSTLRKLIESREKGGGGTIVTTRVPDPTGYGRILRSAEGLVAAIVEQKMASPEQQRITEINPGAYCFEAAPFWRHIEEIEPNNAAGEYYLTDMVGLLTASGHGIYPLLVEDETELLGINTRVELAVADRILRQRKATACMLNGVTVRFPETVAIDPDVEIGEDTTVEAAAHLLGCTKIGANCAIGVGSILRDCTVADGVTVLPYVVAEQSTFAAGAVVGPFARFRMDAAVDEGAQVGNFVELKKTRLGKNAKANHLAYLGDATIGAGSNIGAGTITCNYDGQKKHPTTIGEGAFVGSNSTLVAPITINDGAYVGAGSVITKNVAADALAIGRAHQVEKEGWAKRRRAAREAQPAHRL